MHECGICKTQYATENEVVACICSHNVCIGFADEEPRTGIEKFWAEYEITQQQFDRKFLKETGIIWEELNHENQ